MAFSYVPCSKEDTYDLIRQAQSGDESSREQLVNQNTGLVKNIALKFVSGDHELEDLLQIGFIGLLKAVDRFDVSYNVMFSTYAVPMILGEIKRYLRDDGRVKVGRQIKQDVRNMKRAHEAFCHTHGRSPKISELAEQMELDVEDVLSLMEASDAMSNPESLDDPERQETAADDRFREVEEQQVILIHLKGVIRSLSERERQIIVLRYFKDMTQQQIADRLGISQVQVSRIEKRVLANLRQELE
ncbi:MAG: SigB/SigF/SigG family RNA polymerase sigma factor [Eubacteriales bacterium]|nr:SigB/SigF/SigG family RNA polymerase sigma factor [Eubacteriales bacterium]MDD3874668.1 SigB/SigF/SigG family RNA polymerase sigma factor [Methanosarcina sp.]